MADPVTMISTVSAAFQAVQTWIALRNSSRTYSVAQHGFSRTRKAKLARIEGRRLSKLIPAPVLTTMVKRLQRCWDIYQNTIDPDKNRMPKEIDNATDALKQCICEELHRIYKLNKSIPPGKLRQWWNAYCQE